MTDTTERAELLALADEIDLFIKHGTDAVFGHDDAQEVASALRRLAGQDQKLVAWHSPTDSVTPFVKPHIKEAMLPHAAAQYSVPLYLSPPPAAGWEDAIEAACKICSFAIGQTHNMSRMAMAEELRDAIEALRHNAPPDSGATKSAPPVVRSLPDNGESDLSVMPDHGGADVGVKPFAWRQINAYEACNGTIWRTADEAMAESKRTNATISHKPDAAETNASAEARPEIMGIYSKPGTKVRFSGEGGYEHQNIYAKEHLTVGETYTVAKTDVGDWHTDVTLAEFPDYKFNSVLFEALSAHSHASDCDKQECMGDASPGDAKDLQELLAKPSVLEPSDRPADVTMEQAAHKCADDLVLIVEAATKMAHRTGNTFVIDRARVASMIAGHFNAFTVGRR